MAAVTVHACTSRLLCATRFLATREASTSAVPWTAQPSSRARAGPSAAVAAATTTAATASRLGVQRGAPLFFSPFTTLPRRGSACLASRAPAMRNIALEARPGVTAARSSLLSSVSDRQFGGYGGRDVQLRKHAGFASREWSRHSTACRAALGAQVGNFGSVLSALMGG